MDNRNKVNKPIQARVTSTRKQACLGCRKRKKRCDSLHPSCTPCRKWNVVCEYNGSNVPQPLLPTPIPGEAGVDLMANDFSEWPLFEWAKQPAAESTTSSAVPLPLDSSMVYRDGASIPSPGVLGVVEMPPREQALELVDIFFDRFSWLLPCFREATLREGFSTQEIQNRAPVLAYAIFAMAAPHHSEAAIRDQAESWYNNAKLSYDLTDHHSDRTLWVLQAAVCIIFHCFTTLRGSGMWLFIGKAWRQACWAGLNRMDSGVEPPLGDIPDAALPWEKEERRRTLWVLFILDRTCSFISGRTPAIDERYFAVNVPLPDGMFHCGVDIPIQGSGVSLPASLDAAGLSSVLVSQLRPAGPLQQLVIVYAVLGQVTAYCQTSSAPYDLDPHRLLDLQNLLQSVGSCSTLLAEGIQTKSLSERFHTIWLFVTLQTAAILLHYPRCQASQNASAGSVSELGTVAASLGKCRQAASSVLLHLKGLLASDPQNKIILANPYVATGIFMSAYVLTAHWHTTDGLEAQSGVYAATETFGRLRGEFPALGQKFMSGIECGLLFKKELALQQGMRGMFCCSCRP